MSAQMTAVLQYVEKIRDCSCAAEIIFRAQQQAKEAAVGAWKFPGSATS